MKRDPPGGQVPLLCTNSWPLSAALWRHDPVTGPL